MTTQRIHQLHVLKSEHGHTTWQVREVVDALHRGTLWVEICDECFYVKAHCMHSQNSWHEDRLLNQTLICNLCGKDVT